MLISECNVLIPFILVEQNILKTHVYADKLFSQCNTLY